MSVSNLESEVDKKVKNELLKGRIEGPFSSSPLNNLKISPLAIIPKRQQNSFRLIHDLSFPRGNSVNSHIPTEFSKVTYETLDHIVALVQKFGKDSLISKVDIEDAFRIMPIHPKDYNLLGFMFREKIYYDKCLPMGCSTSCQTFEKFSQAIQWLLQNHFKIAGISHILDDFIFVGPANSSFCQYGLDTFLTLAKDINIPVKAEKTVLPTTCCIVHGVIIDTNSLELRLPLEKLERLRCALDLIKNKRTVKLKDLQSVLGLLAFACTVVVPGRTFLRRLYNLTCGVHFAHHHVNMTSEARADLKALQIFLDEFNGRRFFVCDVWTSSNVLKLYTDASSSLGYAAVFGPKWIAGKWHKTFSSADICVLELFPIMLAVETWGDELSNSCVLFITDNEALVAILNKQTSKCSKIMKLLRQFIVSCMVYNIFFKAQHIAGKHNTIADKLSRCVNFRRQKC